MCDAQPSNVEWAPNIVGERMRHMPDNEHDYTVRPGRPPLHTVSERASPGIPAVGAKELPALPADALNQPVFVTINGRRRKIPNREAVIHQRVNKSTSADLRVTKMPMDMVEDVERKAGMGNSPIRGSGRILGRREWA
jgi:hypothetical protein